MYGEQVSLLREGVQSHTIYYLQPNTTYYVKVRGQNGCMPGGWGNTMKFKTNSQIYYKNFSPVSNTIDSLITRVSSKNISSPTTTPKVTPTVTPSPKPTESPKQSETNSQPDNQTPKRCLLWWCW